MYPYPAKRAVSRRPRLTRASVRHYCQPSPSEVVSHLERCCSALKVRVSGSWSILESPEESHGARR